MKILIVEDEIPAQRLLVQYINQLRPAWEIDDCLQSVEETIEYFQNGHEPDLVFVDVQLTDGLSFEAIDKIQHDVPLIFVTAFDEYAVRAFQVNGLDYILKPLDINELEKGVEKFEQSQIVVDRGLFQDFLVDFQQRKKAYRKRLLLNQVDGIEVLMVEDVALFSVEDRQVYAHTFMGKVFKVDFRLDKLEEDLDPELFFRVNRQQMIHVEAIKKLEPYFSGKWVVKTNLKEVAPLVIPKDKVVKIKQWLDR
ncbi:LytTR family DNA-binding domain-containing protein [Persicobacter diffluens]|uniref:DNA-binding response regulator n=1 Tax=Persicobacter diffluens TaxID=981 RepID=A0AAN4W369_9BACT|nr:DNA-binding response regulator [Persicobacter diffluens]